MYFGYWGLFNLNIYVSLVMYKVWNEMIFFSQSDFVLPISNQNLTNKNLAWWDKSDETCRYIFASLIFFSVLPEFVTIQYWLPILAMDSKHMILSITSITFFWRSGDWKKWHSLIHFITVGKFYPNLYTTWSISNSIQILHLKKWKVACNFKGGQILIS